MLVARVEPNIEYLHKYLNRPESGQRWLRGMQV